MTALLYRFSLDLASLPKSFRQTKESPRPRASRSSWSTLCVNTLLVSAGVWGGKGQGKSFQIELIFRALGLEPVIMSAGELESEWAGEAFTGSGLEPALSGGRYFAF